jgi:hypothetical protein
MSKRKVWVLDTGTKGTGAEMVPLEKVLKTPGPGPQPAVASERRRRRPAREPEPRPARRFKVVDVMTRSVLAEDVDARAALAALTQVSTVVDARVYVWQPSAEKWRLLTLAEQQAMWDLRDQAD